MNTNKSVAGGKVSTKEYVGYFSYGFGECFSYGLVGTFIVYFYTEVLGISTAVAGIIFLIARVWDAVNDPIVAGIMDTRKTKEGKFKGYMKWVPIFVVVSTILCFFSPNLSLNYKIIYAAVTYILWGTIYTVSDIPFWSLSAVISNDPQQRTSLVTCANLGVYAGIGTVGVLIPMMVKAIGQGDEGRGYLFSVIIVMAIGYGFMMFGHSTIHERVESERNEKVTVKDVAASLKSNKHLLKMLIVFFMNVFMNMVNGIILYFFKFNVGNVDLMSIYSLFGTFSAVGFFLIPKLAQKFKKKNIIIAIVSMDMIFRILFFLVGCENVTFLMTMLLITQVFHASIGPLMSTMISETIEYAEVQTGKRCEAITFSGQTFTGKLAAAFGGLFVTIVLSVIGFVQQSDVQSAGTINGLFIAISILPIVGNIIRLIVMSRYTYTEDEFKKDLEIIKKRKDVNTTE